VVKWVVTGQSHLFFPVSSTWPPPFLPLLVLVFREKFLAQVQSLEVMPFIEEVLNNIDTIICDLQPQQVHTFYEAVGYMIQAQVVSRKNW